MYNLSNEKPEPGLETFIPEFLDDRFNEINEIRKSLDSNDHSILHELTHKWIGFSKPYGFIWLEGAAKELKEIAREGKTEQASILIDKIEEYLEAKKKQLK